LHAVKINLSPSRLLVDVPEQTPTQKECKGCHRTKPIEAFCRPQGTNPQHMHATCNQCSEKLKNKRKEKNVVSRKRSKLENNQDTAPDESVSMSRSISASSNTFMSRSSSASSTFSLSGINDGLQNLEMQPEESSFQDEQMPDKEQTDSTTYKNNCYDSDVGGFLYTFDEVQELIAESFQEAESLNIPTTLAFEIEFSPNLIEIVSANQENFQLDTVDLDEISNGFHRLADTICSRIESGSGYYWEVRKVNAHSKRKKPTGSATVYLGCRQRTDRRWQRPEDQPVKRMSEARAPIDRYSCKGSIKLSIDLQQHFILVQGEHQEAHQHPQYRQTEFPAKARQWIQENIKYNLRNVEVYRRLCNLGYINTQIHTKEQVAYWVSVHSRKTYVMDPENQLSSTKAYLEKSEFMTKGYKVLCCIENDFVRALGFITPFFDHIGASKVTEVVIDSTFKTNQERFELFVVNNNCGGYGMPLAYLYLSTSDGSETACDNPNNEIKTRVGVLRTFFTSLRQKGLHPVFVLLDKDAGEIAAVSEAWSWTSQIQLCYWHLEHAIDRRLKDKKSKQSAYSAAKALEAHSKFDFIDSSWVPKGNAGSFCPDDAAKEVVELVKKHSNMHPLIPVAKNTFLTSKEIYHRSVNEMYEFCSSRDLVRLWGYLWANWYNEKDWKLFARSSYPTAMPLSRTTMITESHWRVLKYNYKYNYNRPRLDRLTQILAEHLVPDFESKLAQYNGNRSFPAWWQAFKKDWRMAATRDIQPGMDERHHIDVNSWVCSCEAYIRSRYLICKHLVYKKDGKDFIPSFLQTTRRHDYPLVTFSSDNMPTITIGNNPWSRFAQSVEEDDPVEESAGQNIEHNVLIQSQHDDMEKRWELVAEYEKKFKSAIDLLKKEVDNDKFVKNFNTLAKPLITAVDECEEALRARHQQSTWGSKKGKLSLWLR
jgi:hypothetical protein